MSIEKPNTSRKKPEKRMLDNIVQKILEIVNPRQIILFGSAARGSMTSDSDLDILVVMPDGIHRRKTAQTIYSNLTGLGISKDIIVVTETDIRDYGNNPSLVLYPALQQGKVIYHAI